MKAKQLIYTSWKNGDNPNKGYMVYSKSPDISNEDTEAICKVMAYRVPNSAPSFPTEEEIVSCFPVNCASFTLPSGSLCIAKATYIGMDYSNRPGNYMIHAYILDAGTKVNPLTFCFANAQFKTRLTDEEANAPQAPQYLPIVELADELFCEATQDEISAYIANSYNNRLLPQLMQAVINRKAGEHIKICLNGDFAFLQTTLRILGTLLPKNIASHTSYQTYILNESNQADIMCVYPDRYGFTYNQYVEQNIFAADVSTSLITMELQIDTYVSRIIEQLNRSVYEACRMSNIVGAILSNSNCTIDEAIQLYMLISQPKLFSSVDDMLQILSIAEEKYPSGLETIAFGLHSYVNCVSDASITAARDSYVAIYRFLFKHIPTSELAMLCEETFNREQALFGRYTEISRIECVRSYLTTSADTYINHIPELALAGRIVADSLDAKKFISACMAAKLETTNEKEAEYYQYAFAQVLLPLFDSDLNAFILYIREVIVYSADRIANSILNQKSSLTDNQVIALLLIVSKDVIVKQILMTRNGNACTESFLKLLANSMKQKSQIDANVSSVIYSDSHFAEMAERLDSLRYNNNSNITKQDLEQYFYHQYVIGANKQRFIQMLRVYLNRMDEKSRILEAYRLYKKFFSASDNGRKYAQAVARTCTPPYSADDKRCVLLLADAMFDGVFLDLKEAVNMWNPTCAEFCNARNEIMNNGVNIPEYGMFDLVTLFYMLSTDEIIKVNQSRLITACEDDSLYDSVIRAPGATGITCKHLMPVLYQFAMYLSEKSMFTTIIAQSLFSFPSGSNMFESSFCEAMAKSKQTAKCDRPLFTALMPAILENSEFGQKCGRILCKYITSFGLMKKLSKNAFVNELIVSCGANAAHARSYFIAQGILKDDRRDGDKKTR